MTRQKPFLRFSRDSQISFQMPDVMLLKHECVVPADYRACFSISREGRQTGQLKLGAIAAPTPSMLKAVVEETTLPLIRRGCHFEPSALIQAMCPDRFQCAWYFAPKATIDGKPLEFELLIYLVRDYLLFLNLVGPTRELAQEDWKHNLTTFQQVRNSLNIGL